MTLIHRSEEYTLTCRIFMYTYAFVCDFFCSGTYNYIKRVYGVASISRLLKIIFLFCRIQSLLFGSFALETYTFQEPTNRGHPIPIEWCWIVQMSILCTCIYIASSQIDTAMKAHYDTAVLMKKCMYIYVNTYIYVFIHMHIHMLLCVYVYIYVYICVGVCTCIYACVYVYIYIHTHTHTP